MCKYAGVFIIGMRLLNYYAQTKGVRTVPRVLFVNCNKINCSNTAFFFLLFYINMWLVRLIYLCCCIVFLWKNFETKKMFSFVGAVVWGLCGKFPTLLSLCLSNCISSTNLNCILCRRYHLGDLGRRQSSIQLRQFSTSSRFHCWVHPPVLHDERQKQLSWYTVLPRTTPFNYTFIHVHSLLPLCCTGTGYRYLLYIIQEIETGTKCKNVKIYV